MANSSLNQYDVTSEIQEKRQEKQEADDPILRPSHPHAHIFIPIEKLDFPNKNMILWLPQEKRWVGAVLRKYQGFWHLEGTLSMIMSLQNSFRPRPNDVLIASFPKCGTTWLKAILFATVNRNKYDFATHPLLRINPHDCVPLIEHLFPKGNQDYSYLESLPSPRILGSHVTYSTLPDAIKASRCKIVYICRDPKDVIVSMWHMVKGLRARDQPFPFSQAFELFCNGRSPLGPIWEHMLEYRNESLQCPEKILYLMYENLLENPLEWVKKIADFLGCSFSNKEEMEGVPQKIVELCSFKSLKDLDVNEKTHGDMNSVSMNHIFFRKGVIGDWRNHMSLEMADRVDVITKEKFAGSGLTFTNSVTESYC
ncbi:hypothetical protein LUZ60_016775 [Juncus effusus]|nr:hypothetical protein LUZ60_016775 [Juncus effusus]